MARVTVLCQTQVEDGLFSLLQQIGQFLALIPMRPMHAPGREIQQSARESRPYMVALVL